MCEIITMERSCKSILKQFQTRPAQLESCATGYVKQVLWNCMQEWVQTCFYQLGLRRTDPDMASYM